LKRLSRENMRGTGAAPQSAPAAAPPRTPY
jgi:hypothetical protein